MPAKSKTPTFKQQHSAEYECWVNMLHRCHNPNHADYPNYGGRGIYVCDEWRDAVTGFTTFYNDMQDRPANHSIERVDNDRGYSKSNCDWADRKTQQLNRRSHRYAILDFGHGHDARGNPIIEYNGEKKPLPVWAADRNMRATTLRSRFKAGFTVEQALTTPVGKLRTGGKGNKGLIKSLTIH